MTVFEILALLISLSAFFGFLNYRFLKFPMTIGLMAIAIVFSLLLIGLGKLGLGFEDTAKSILGQVDFSKALLDGVLSVLLFAGALHVNFEDLKKQARIVAFLASFGTIVSTFATGLATFYLVQIFGYEIPLTYALLFGALISPTDPIAVMAIIKKLNVSKSLSTKITGESLFNDGIAVVLFMILLGITTSDEGFRFEPAIKLILIEAVGGAFFGGGIGYFGYLLLKKIDDYSLEVLITLALVTGGYVLASRLHTSGPIAIVVAGLLIGNQGREFAMSDKTRHHLDTFWELMDELLNAILFMFIGLEILVLPFEAGHFLLGVAMIPVVLLVRFGTVGLGIELLKHRRVFSKNVVKILTWGGLRGGISVALALSIPENPYRDLILTVTYLVVAFSILVQGLTIKHLLK